MNLFWINKVMQPVKFLHNIAHAYLHFGWWFILWHDVMIQIINTMSECAILIQRKAKSNWTTVKEAIFYKAPKRNSWTYCVSVDTVGSLFYVERTVKMWLATLTVINSKKWCYSLVNINNNQTTNKLCLRPASSPAHWNIFTSLSNVLPWYFRAKVSRI